MELWVAHQSPSSVCTTRHLQSKTSDANERKNDGHETTTMAARSVVKQERQAKVAELFSRGLDKKAIAVELGVPLHRVRNDFSVLGLTPRTRNLDRTQALALADLEMPWKQAAKEAGISHSQFCEWMKEAGRTPPPKKTKHRLKPQAFAMYESGKSWEQICATLGIATATLSQWLRSRGTNEAHTPAAQGNPMTITAAILNDFSQTTLGGSVYAPWDAMLKCSAASAPGSSSSGGVRRYTEFDAFLVTTLGESHPMVKKYRGDFAGQLSAEASSR